MKHCLLSYRKLWLAGWVSKSLSGGLGKTVGSALVLLPGASDADTFESRRTRTWYVCQPFESRRRVTGSFGWAGRLAKKRR